MSSIFELRARDARSGNYRKSRFTFDNQTALRLVLRVKKSWKINTCDICDTKTFPWKIIDHFPGKYFRINPNPNRIRVRIRNKKKL